MSEALFPPRLAEALDVVGVGDPIYTISVKTHKAGGSFLWDFTDGVGYYYMHLQAGIHGWICELCPGTGGVRFYLPHTWQSEMYNASLAGVLDPALWRNDMYGISRRAYSDAEQARVIPAAYQPGHWNTRCPRCGSEGYQGLGPIECSRSCGQVSPYDTRIG